MLGRLEGGLERLAIKDLHAGLSHAAPAQRRTLERPNEIAWRIGGAQEKVRSSKPPKPGMLESRSPAGDLEFSVIAFPPGCKMAVRRKQ